VVALIAFATGQRAQNLSAIKIDDIVWGSSVQITVSKIIKTTTVSKSNPVLVLPAFEDKSLSPVVALQHYVNVTSTLMMSNDLFIGITKPHNNVGSQTISRWLVTVLKLAGVDVIKIHAHSFRHSSTFKASGLGVNIDTIFKRVGWSMGSKMFAKFYKRPFEDIEEFANNVLSTK